MTTSYLPVLDLASIYSAARQPREAQRWHALTQQFEQQYGSKPHFISRAPGRVNIIGEHIDHMGFSVLPAALEMDILMLVRVTRAPAGQAPPKTLQIELRNTVPRFEATSFECDVDSLAGVELQHEGGSRWANYWKVALRGLHPHLPASVLSAESRPTKLEVLVDGTIPPESSLSSSAAMTVCSSMVVLEAFGARKQIGREEMADVAIESERLVGVASGGMDQAASIFGVPSHALHISFFPKLSIRSLRLPDSKPKHTFLIANTLVVSDKKVSGPVQYNLRVVELWMAARVLAKKLGLPLDDSTKTLRKLMHVYFEKHPLEDKAAQALGEEAAQIKKLGELAEGILPAHDVTRAEVEQLTGFEGEAFDKEFLSAFPIRADKFRLQARTRHVFAEAYRVHEFAALAERGAEGVYDELGALMNASQASLMQDYENGCPEILDVVRLAREAGASGSRATGAGWGGSTVHLVREDRVQSVLEALRTGFYAKRWPELSAEKLEQSLLVSDPASGAGLMLLD